MLKKTLEQPTPAEVRSRRLRAGLTRRQAAELVHAIDQDGRGSYRTWQNYELPSSSPESRAIPLATWELFILKTDPIIARIRERERR